MLSRVSIAYRKNQSNLILSARWKSKSQRTRSPALKPLVARLRYASQVFQIRFLYLNSGNEGGLKSFKVIPQHQPTLMSRIRRNVGFSRKHRSTEYNMSARCCYSNATSTPTHGEAAKPRRNGKKGGKKRRLIHKGQENCQQ